MGPYVRELRGSNFYVGCVGLCLGQNVLRGSKIFAWVIFFFFFLALVNFYLLDEIILLYTINSLENFFASPLPTNLD